MFWDFEKLVASGFDLEFRFVIFFFKKNSGLFCY